MDDAWPESTGEALHTSTFLGNPLGCRMALESLRLLESGKWRARVEKLGAHLDAGLRKLRAKSKRWGWTRGLGLMRGLESSMKKAGLTQPLPAESSSKCSDAASSCSAAAST